LLVVDRLEHISWYETWRWCFYQTYLDQFYALILIIYLKHKHTIMLNMDV